MKYLSLLAALAFALGCRAESINEFFSKNRLPNEKSYLACTVSVQNNEMHAEIRNVSDSEITYLSAVPAAPRLLAEKLIDGKWVIVRSELCGGVVNRWALKPTEKIRFSIPKPADPGTYRHYFAFGIAGSDKNGIVEIANQPE